MTVCSDLFCSVLHVATSGGHDRLFLRERSRDFRAERSTVQRTASEDEVSVRIRVRVKMKRGKGEVGLG